MAPIALFGIAVFWIPRELTGLVGTNASKKEGDDSIPTFRVLYGGVFFLLWFLLLSVAVGYRVGWIAGVGALLFLPALALAAVEIGDSQRFVLNAARRYFTLRRHRGRVAALRQHQHEIALRLRDLMRELGP
jgi:hypothetical protein